MTDRENVAFIVRDEWTAWVKGFTASLSELDKNATSRIYDNMDFYDMQYRFTEKYKKVPEYLDEDGKPTQKLKDLIKEKRKKIAGAASVKDYLKFTATENGTTIQYYVNGASLDIDMGYSKDGSTFIKWQPNTDISLDSGESIYIWNKTNTLSITPQNYVRLITNKNCTVSGNINSLLNFDDVKPNCFANLFVDTQITDFSKVQFPSMALAENCYYAMFEESYGIMYAPEFPATSLPSGCYERMFDGCINLLGGVTIGASVSAGERSCYYMFNGCTSLTSAPELNALTLAPGCYLNMFTGCRSLQVVPELPATTLADNCYASMFANSGIQTGPDIKATTLANMCFDNMFLNCTSLNSIKLAYTGDFIESQFNGWVTGVPNTGILYYSGADTSNFGYSAIPKDASNHWNVQPY